MNSRKKEILKEVALRLKELREQQGCSPVEMASRLGISRGAYNKNEHGINFPCIDTQRRLSKKCARCMTAMIKVKCFSEKNKFFLSYLHRDSCDLISIAARAF